MVKQHTADELSAKIQAIKAERERTASALKKYEEELERRKKKNWLPLTAVFYSAKYESVDVFRVEFKAETTFNNYSCFDKYRDYLETINKTLVANSKGEPISIEVLLPLLKKGYVAMDKNGDWHWYAKKPKQGSGEWIATGFITSFHAFNLKPAENWKDSLKDCGL